MFNNCLYKQKIIPELIKEECQVLKNYSEIKLTSKFISWLFNQYEVFQYTVNFYDAEPSEEEKQQPDFDWEQFENTKRMVFNNWVDIFGSGIWDMTQKEVDQSARSVLKEFRKSGHLKGRCWMAKSNKMLHLFCYGRDIHKYDLHFIMVPRGRLIQLKYNIHVPDEIQTRLSEGRHVNLSFTLKDAETGMPLTDYLGKPTQYEYPFYFNSELGKPNHVLWQMDKNDLKHMEKNYIDVLWIVGENENRGSETTKI